MKYISFDTIINYRGFTVFIKKKNVKDKNISFGSSSVIIIKLKMTRASSSTTIKWAFFLYNLIGKNNNTKRNQMIKKSKVKKKKIEKYELKCFSL